jgi:putative addiction module component (TIGR02574 family)
MAQITPQVSKVLEKALTLSTQEHGVFIDRLIERLDEDPPEEGVEEAWAEEIKRRVDDIGSGKVKTIAGEQVHRELAKDSTMRSKQFRFHPWGNRRFSGKRSDGTVAGAQPSRGAASPR